MCIAFIDSKTVYESSFVGCGQADAFAHEYFHLKARDQRICIQPFAKVSPTNEPAQIERLGANSVVAEGGVEQRKTGAPVFISIASVENAAEEFGDAGIAAFEKEIGSGSKTNAQLIADCGVADQKSVGHIDPCPARLISRPFSDVIPFRGGAEWVTAQGMIQMFFQSVVADKGAVGYMTDDAQEKVVLKRRIGLCTPLLALVRCISAFSGAVWPTRSGRSFGLSFFDLFLGLVQSYLGCGCIYKRQKECECEKTFGH